MRKCWIVALAASALHAAVIHGTVVENQTGHALARTLVALRPVAGTAGPSVAIRTNSYGAFEFQNIPAGSYLITASRSGSVTVQYGQRQSRASGVPLVVAENDSPNLAIRLPRFGAIMGTILDENDVGLQEYDVVAYRNTRPPRLVAHAKSDDRGVYRLHGLEAGSYLVRGAGKLHYWRNIGLSKKTKFISLQNSYHGETLGALSVTDVAIFKDTYAPLLQQSAQMPSPDFRLAAVGENAEAYALRCADALALYVAEHQAELAAFIIEPLVQCAAGMGMYHPTYLKRAREICTQYKIHLIADEIAVGFGRTGTMFACEQAFSSPRPIGERDSMTSDSKASDIADFICLSKGITGGYLPLSAVLTTNQIYAAFYDDSTARGFLHSHSYTGNPLACSAALATLAIFETDNVIATNQQKSAYIAASINSKMQALANLPMKHLRHTGMIFAFDVITQNKHFQQQFYVAALAKGLLLRPIGNTVYFMPPYIINEAEIDYLVDGALQTILQITQDVA